MIYHHVSVWIKQAKIFTCTAVMIFKLCWKEKWLISSIWHSSHSLLVNFLWVSQIFDKIFTVMHHVTLLVCSSFLLLQTSSVSHFRRQHVMSCVSYRFSCLMRRFQPLCPHLQNQNKELTDIKLCRASDDSQRDQKIKSLTKVHVNDYNVGPFATCQLCSHLT